ncbi:MAG: hypothetical protein ABIF18_03070 [archaeon]
MNKYKVLNKYETEAYRDYAVKTIKKWHSKCKPGVIILNETSATPMGWVFKEAWKNAYPDEKLPKFMAINPRYGKLNKRQKKYLKDKNAAVIVYDEFWQKYGIIKDTFFQRYKYGQKLLGSKYEKYKLFGDTKFHFEKTSNDIYNHGSLDLVATLVAKQGVKNIFFEHSSPEEFYGPATKANAKNIMEEGYSAEGCAEFRKDNKPILIKEGDIITRGGYCSNIYIHGKPTWKETYEKPRLVKGHLRKKSLKFIHDLKQAGKEAGEEIIQQRNTDSLEKKVMFGFSSVIILFSLFLLSPNLTGNVIGNLSNGSSNLIGGVLFFIGLIGAMFYFKKK